MLVRILCQNCGFEVRDDDECRKLMEHREDWVRFMIQRASSRGKTARFLRTRLVPCPRCDSTTHWISQMHEEA